MDLARALEIIDKMADLIDDEIGLDTAIRELEVNYNIKFTTDEIAWLKRGRG